MRPHHTLVLLAAFLTGCAAPQTYSDAHNALERKTYITCAVTRAFLDAGGGASPRETARTAIGQCRNERRALYAKLVAENVGKPFAMSFVEGYMDELHATMLEHIALRLEQASTQKQSGSHT